MNRIPGLFIGPPIKLRPRRRYGTEPIEGPVYTPNDYDMVLAAGPFSLAEDEAPVMEEMVARTVVHMDLLPEEWEVLHEDHAAYDYLAGRLVANEFPLFRVGENRTLFQDRHGGLYGLRVVRLIP